MKVLMTADAVGGVWTYAVELCAALRDHDVRVVLATMGPRPSDEQRRAALSLGNVNLIESDYRLEWMEHPWDDVTAAGDWLLELASASDVDVVHLNGYTHAALEWGRPVVCVAHSCVMTWWQAVHGVPAPSEWELYRHNITRGLNAADCVIAPSASFLEQLRSCYAFSRPARVIHNARSSGSLLGEEMPQWLATAGKGVPPPGTAHPPFPLPNGFRLHPNQPLILACGRLWDASKNMRVLDAAAEGAQWDVHVIGCVEGPNGQVFAPSGLKCLGRLPTPEVQAWLRRAKVFVHPALYEPFGLAVLEAAIAECALVLADIPTLRELWDGAAAFFDPHDSRALRDMLDQLATDPSKQQTLAAAARERAQRYCIKGMAAEYATLYRELTTKHKAKKHQNRRHQNRKHRASKRAVA